MDMFITFIVVLVSGAYVCICMHTSKLAKLYILYFIYVKYMKCFCVSMIPQYSC